jgi:hypothetical protein
LALLAGVGFALGARGALAQTASEIATAKQWFSEGLAHEEKAEWSAALDLFRRAVQVKRTPQIVYHVGLCESRTGGLVEALVDLDSAVGLARAANVDNVVAAARAELADVKARIPTLDVRVAAGSSPSRFIVDGSAIALPMLHTAMPLDPGEHTVTIEFASGASATSKTALAEHDAKTIELAAPAAAPIVPSVPPPSSPASPPPGPLATSPSGDDHPAAHGASPIPWVLVGGGGALLVAGAVFFADARVQEGSLHTSCPTRTDCDPSLQGSYNTAVTLNGVGIGLGAAGLAAVAVGATLIGLRAPTSTASAVVVGPGRVGWTVRF